MRNKCIGAIVGDIVGSIYEFDNIKTKDFELFSAGASITDDSIMTIATMQALLDGGTAESLITNYQRLGNKYPSSYGNAFRAGYEKKTLSHTLMGQRFGNAC